MAILVVVVYAYGMSEQSASTTKPLNPKQELFCKLFATERDFFGNGTTAYMEAYGVENNQGTRQSASKLLTNAHILARVNELLDYNGLNDVSVDRELAFVIAQSADYGSKVAAIREYNKLRNRITERLDMTSKGEQISAPIDAGVAAAFAQALTTQTKGE